jgi:cysteine-rich repeat protein
MMIPRSAPSLEYNQEEALQALGSWTSLDVGDMDFFLANTLRKKARGLIPRVVLALLLILPSAVSADVATTTLLISVCGNGTVDGVEVCDIPPNTGGYSTSTAGRTCEPGCSAFGEYCGDSILQPIFGESCDDGNNTAGDLCDAICVQETPPGSGGTPPPPPPPSGGGGGAGGQFSGIVPVRLDTRVVLEGKAYPSADVNILKDGQVVGVSRADSNASFRYESNTLTPGPATFGIWARDSQGVKSITFNTTFQVIQNALTTVSGILLPPTIDAVQKKVKQGEPITFIGETAPLAQVSAFMNALEEPFGSATTSNGRWSVAAETSNLENESFHSAKALFTLSGASAQEKSGYSSSLSFYVGEAEIGDVISADLNNDGKVNLVDFSILLFHWGTSSPIADINRDGNVNLTDFSILLFNWTG